MQVIGCMSVGFNKRREVSPYFLGMQTIDVIKFPPNAAPQVRIKGCIYPDLKIICFCVGYRI